MSTQIFINLPVKNLDAAKAFYTAVGFNNNAQYTDDTAACMALDETIFVMLLTEEKFRSFSPAGVCDTESANEVLNALTCQSKADVDSWVTKATAAGGRTFKEPIDYGFMYSQSFQDLDGHVWELVFMDPNATPPSA